MQNYQKYLSEVLGIDQVLAGEVSTETSEAGIHFFSPSGPFSFAEGDYELVFLNIISQSKESLFIPEVAELFTKMKAAMRLKNIKCVELDVTLEDRSVLPAEFSKKARARMVVVFSSFPKNMGEIIIKGSSRWIETYSPAY